MRAVLLGLRRQSHSLHSEILETQMTVREKCQRCGEQLEPVPKFSFGDRAVVHNCKPVADTADKVRDVILSQEELGHLTQCVFQNSTSLDTKAQLMVIEKSHEALREEVRRLKRERGNGVL